MMGTTMCVYSLVTPFKMCSIIIHALLTSAYLATEVPSHNLVYTNTNLSQLHLTA